MKVKMSVLKLTVVTAVMLVLATFAYARTVGVGYFDALVIGTDRANPTASITSAGVITGSTLVTGAKVTASAGAVTLYSRSKAQINAITPVAVGEVYYCNDCTSEVICVSTRTAVGGISKGTDRTAHCN